MGVTPDNMDVVAWRFRSKDGYGDWSHSSDEPTYLDSRAYDVQPLYASPVVPAGREDKEAANTLERQAAEIARMRGALMITRDAMEASGGWDGDEEVFDMIVAALTGEDRDKE